MRQLFREAPGGPFRSCSLCSEHINLWDASSPHYNVEKFDLTGISSVVQAGLDVTFSSLKSDGTIHPHTLRHQQERDAASAAELLRELADRQKRYAGFIRRGKVGLFGNIKWKVVWARLDHVHCRLIYGNADTRKSLDLRKYDVSIAEEDTRLEPHVKLQLVRPSIDDDCKKFLLAGPGKGFPDNQGEIQRWFKAILDLRIRPLMKQLEAADSDSCDSEIAAACQPSKKELQEALCKLSLAEADRRDTSPTVQAQPRRFSISEAFKRLTGKSDDLSSPESPSPVPISERRRSMFPSSLEPPGVMALKNSLSPLLIPSKLENSCLDSPVLSPQLNSPKPASPWRFRSTSRNSHDSPVFDSPKLHTPPALVDFPSPVFKEPVGPHFGALSYTDPTLRSWVPRDA